jgi:hypothetical protein
VTPPRDIKINPNAFGSEPISVRPQPPLQVRSIPEVVQELLNRAAPWLLEELREAFQSELARWQKRPSRTRCS